MTLALAALLRKLFLTPSVFKLQLVSMLVALATLMAHSTPDFAVTHRAPHAQRSHRSLLALASRTQPRVSTSRIFAPTPSLCLALLLLLRSVRLSLSEFTTRPTRLALVHSLRCQFLIPSVPNSPLLSLSRVLATLTVHSTVVFVVIFCAILLAAISPIFPLVPASRTQ